MNDLVISSKQNDYICNSNYDVNIAIGSVRSGKTFAQVLRWIDYIYNECPNGCLLMMSARTNESLYDNIIRLMLEFDQIGDIVYSKQPQRVYIKSKNIEIACSGVDNERSWGRIQGKTAHGWLADEIVQHNKSFVNMAYSRVSGGKRYKFWTSNPDSPSHFIKTDYIDNETMSDRIGVWNFNFLDNPDLSDEYVENLKNTYTGIYYDRFISGKWVLAEGVIYDKFNRADHVVKDFPVAEIKEYIIGIDWGYAKDHPLAIILIAVGSGTLWVIDEIYAEKQLIDDSLINLMKRKGWYDLKYQQRDPGSVGSVITHSGIVKPSKAYCDSARPDLLTVFHRKSGITSIGASKEVEDGIQAVQRKFIKGGDGRYGLYILEKCKNVIRELELYRWDQAQSGLGKDVPIKRDDHTTDALRYAIYTRERGTVRFVNLK